MNLFVNGITVLRFTHTLFLPQPRSQLFYARSYFLPLFCPIFCPGLPSTFFQRVLRPLFVRLTSVGRSRITDGLKGRVWRKDVHKNKDGLEKETRISHRLVGARSLLDSGCFTIGVCYQSDHWFLSRTLELSHCCRNKSKCFCEEQTCSFAHILLWSFLNTGVQKNRH